MPDVGRHLLMSIPLLRQEHLERVAQDLIQMAFDCLQGGRCSSLHACFSCRLNTILGHTKRAIITTWLYTVEKPECFGQFHYLFETQVHISVVL